VSALSGDATAVQYNEEQTFTNYETFNTDNVLSEYRVEFFAGVAPKVMAAEKWTVSIPLLAKVYLRRDELKFENEQVYSASSPKAAEYFGYAFAIGPRVYYAVHKNWDIYAGFSVDVISSQNTKRVYWKSAPTDTYMVEFKGNVYFDNEKLVLGIRILWFFVRELTRISANECSEISQSPHSSVEIVFYIIPTSINPPSYHPNEKFARPLFPRFPSRPIGHAVGMCSNPVIHARDSILWFNHMVRSRASMPMIQSGGSSLGLGALRGCPP
jgi:hypothetical protein